ncbi:MAG: DUF6538 domain-containing protein [Desulfatibacillaceae bacterium]
MAGHPRLYRRGATYYHRAAIPKDIRDTYPKSEETFSLKTKNYHEAVRRVRAEAVKVDRRFEQHRQWMSRQTTTGKPISTESAEACRGLHGQPVEHSPRNVQRRTMMPC